MTDDSLTARNRINQRNFRARRQNYIKELEERIRKYESEGVQATIEIQSAARQVTDQNIKLRNLLMQRFGMSDHEISGYLGFPQPSPVVQNQVFQNPFTNISIAPLANLAPAPSGGLAPKPQLSTESSDPYPTPPQQSDLSRSSISAHLDPALSLASLHKYPSPTSSNHDQGAFRDPTPSRQNSNHSFTHHMDMRSSYDTRPSDSPTDTLSESSNPATPAEQIQLDHSRPTQPHSHSYPAPTSCCDPRSDQAATSRAIRPNDETSCEEAARIIASMRGGSDASTDQVMLELGCSEPNTHCKAKNLSIFHLMDRG